MSSEELSLGTNGVNPDKKAGLVERFGLEEVGRFVQLRITNTTGRITVRSTTVQARIDDRALGTKTYQGGV